MELEDLVALGLLLLTVLPSIGLPVPVAAVVVTASSSTMVATVAVASSSYGWHCVVGDCRGACVCVVVLVLLVIHSCASVLLANLLYQEDLQTVGCLFLLFCCSCGSVVANEGAS